MKQRQATRHGQETKKKPFARDKERRPQNRTTRSIDSDVESEGLCRSSEQVERTGHLLLAFHTMLLIFGRSRIEHLPCARAHTHTKTWHALSGGACIWIKPVEWKSQLKHIVIASFHLREIRVRGWVLIFCLLRRVCLLAWIFACYRDANAGRDDDHASSSRGAQRKGACKSGLVYVCPLIQNVTALRRLNLFFSK
jgi:hypothetical protein